MGRFRILPKTVTIRTRAQAEAALLEIGEPKLMALDTETTGIVRSADYAVVISLSTGFNRYVIFEEAFVYFKDLIENPNIYLIMWNANFDCWMLYKAGIDVYRNCPKKHYRVIDAMVMHGLAGDQDRPHGLKAASKEMLGINMVDFKTVFARDLRKKTPLRDIFTDVENEDVVANYTGLDAFSTLRMFYILYKLLIRMRASDAVGSMWDYFIRTEVPFTKILFSCELAGVEIDTEMLISMAPAMERRLNEIHGWFVRATGNMLFNPKSNPQLVELFFEKLGLEPLSFTAGGQPQVSKKFLAKAAREDVQAAALLLEYRDLAKKLDTYIRGIIRAIAWDGKLHTTFNQLGARTGRLSSSGPNLQNQPPFIRAAYIVRSGYRLLARDYNQLEMCVLAHRTQDPNLLEAIETGKDLHCWCASLMFGIPYEDIKGAKDRDDEIDSAKKAGLDYVPLSAYESECLKLRKSAKAINFGLVYGMGAGKLAGELKIDVDAAKGLIRTYFEAFPRVAAYFEDITQEALQRGYCTTELGRRRELPGLFSAIKKDYSAAIRKLKNTPIQGTAAEIVKMAMICLYEDDYLEACGLRMLINVHDELVFEIPEAYEHDTEFNATIEGHMSKPRYLENFTVPLRTSGRYGASWAETK